jgi:hypothetical protein
VDGRKPLAVPQERQIAPALQLQAAQWKVSRPDRLAPEQAAYQAAELPGVLKERRGE